MSTDTMSARLRQTRENLGWSQDEAARNCDLNRSSIWRYERNGMGMEARSLARVAKTYGVSADWLLGLREEP